jgi:hypothetical protein
MRKRIAGIAVLVGVVALGLGMPAVGTTAPREFTGKPCMNIFVASPSYTSATGAAGETASFAAVLTTPDAPSCAGAVYTVTVTYTDRATGATQTETFTFIGDDTTSEWPISLTIEDAPSEICVSATSRPNSKSNAFADRAPDDADCRVIPLTRSGGASGFG